MKALVFTLGGRTAFFKRPDVNSYAYFSYNNIPKTTLLGMFGAIIGLNGYKQQSNSIYPEFYEKLKDLKVSIIPVSRKGYFSKKIQVINNTTGYYNKDAKRCPCTLNYREQWLFNVKWRIYILDDGSVDEELFSKLTDYLINKKCEYIPYLGKNDHHANLSDTALVELQEIKDIKYINSIFGEEIKTGSTAEDYEVYQYSESLPVNLNNTDNSYEFKKFQFTNLEIDDYPLETRFYKHLGDVLYFF